MSLFARSTPTQAPAPAPVAAEDGGFDRLAATAVDGTVRWLTRSEFEGLPLVERVRLLSGGALRFYRGDRLVTAREALRGR